MNEAAAPETYTTPNVVIERARPEDAEAIADIQRRTWLATYPNEALGITEEAIRTKLDGPNGENIPNRVERWKQRLEADTPDSTTFVARVDGRVLGYTSPHIPAGQRRVGSLYVLPDAQGMGVGRQLLQQNVDWHHEQDPTAPIYLHVATYNEGAVGFYKKFGFEPTGKDATDEVAQLPGGAVIPEMEMVLAPVAT